MQPEFLIVMGVCGVGKSTVGRRLAARLGWRYLEGDEFHPAASVEKMSRGVPLDDADREPWLDRLHDEIDRLRGRGDRAVIACSALKERYRRRLRAGADDLVFVFLHGTRETIARRMAARTDHYMPSGLLDSQLDSLEPPHDAIRCDVDASVDLIVEQALVRLRCVPQDAR